MVNVPTGIWINEEGEIVRPAEPAGWSDAWRTGDQKELKHSKDRYLDAVRNWVEHGIHSPFLSEPEEVRKRMTGPTDEHALATAYYRMGLYLTELGYKDDARKHFSEAMNLRKESWNFKRQAWMLIETQEIRREKFIEAIEELGDQRYYPKIELKNKK
jgi:tetratricopeptide (TPR) repeat protein